MNRYHMLLTNVILLLLSCALDLGLNPYPAIGAIPPPPGYHRITTTDPFTNWLRTIPLKKDRTVFLYDGRRKYNQTAQFAVLDISVGHQDLQQCADAVMRLRAEWLYTRKNYGAICFYTQQGVRLNFLEWTKGQRFRLSGDRLIPCTRQGSNKPCEDRACFDEYLLTVFSYCGTLSLERQLVPISHFQDILPGDVLIKGGSPGHAMMVVDMAEDAAGNKVWLLAQSYMPAQDIHVVVNPVEGKLSPWYSIRADTQVVTPEWTFSTDQLRRWPK
ncbi:MAG: hypothetical protein BGO55_18415 [Sphingobacteriales bacterium 50-39]|nr:MAG: hypothetical protein BGO55_18415 [Sphingobacteriales bacterium 50-39]